MFKRNFIGSSNGWEGTIPLVERFVRTAKVTYVLLLIAVAVLLMGLFPQALQELVPNRAVLNQQVLAAAAEKDSARVAKALRAGASANATDESSYTALILAAAGGRAESVR